MCRAERCNGGYVEGVGIGGGRRGREVVVLRCRGVEVSRWWVSRGRCTVGGRTHGREQALCVRVDETSACSVVRSCFLPPAAAHSNCSSCPCPGCRSASCPADACRLGHLSFHSTPLHSSPIHPLITSRRRHFSASSFCAGASDTTSHAPLASPMRLTASKWCSHSKLFFVLTGYCFARGLVRLSRARELLHSLSYDGVLELELPNSSSLPYDSDAPRW